MRYSFPSFAKINLHLEVRDRRPDGFHELVTVFQTVDAHDLLEVEARPAGPPGIDFRVLEGDAPDGPDNLVVRAAAAALERWAPAAGVTLGLRKRLPIGAGLGGGSGNAATALRAIVATLGLRVDPIELAEVAADLGADVPYFLTGGTALGLGRGDRIEPLSPEVPPAEVWLLTPPIAVSTAEVFARLEVPPRRRPVAELEAWRRGSPPADPWGGPWRNDLEPTVRGLYKRVDAVYNPAIRAGASCVRLSGSGGTVFALFREGGPDGLAERLPPGTVTQRVRTLDRESYGRRLSVPEVAGGQ